MIHLRIEKVIQIFLPWAPLVDGNTIPMHYLDALQQGKWNKVPLIIGNDEADAILFVYGAKNDSDLSFLEYALVLGLLFNQDSPQVSDEYPAHQDKRDYRPLMSQLGTDYIFTCPTRYVAKLTQKQNIPVFLYMFNHSLSWPGWGDEFAFCEGKACHAVELPFQFSAPELHRQINWTRAEFDLSLSLMSAWTNFAYTNDPNNGPMRLGTKWPQWDPSGLQTFMFETPNNRVQSRVFKDKCDFWDNLGGLYHYGW